MTNDELGKRLDKLEGDYSELNKTMSTLASDIAVISQVLKQNQELTPRVSALEKKNHELELDLSNARLVQKGFLWLGTMVAGSVVTMGITLWRSTL
jgi:predicted nuclease with TOPRIM domain